VRTTVNIDEHLLTEAKLLAARTRRTLGAVVDDALRMVLAPDYAGGSGERRVRLPTDGGSGLQPGVDLEDREALAEILGDNAAPRAAR
jgi:hypothetical protein